MPVALWLLASSAGAIAAGTAATPSANNISVVVPTEGTPADARDVAAQRRVEEANDLIQAKRPEAALPILDAVLADFATRFPAGQSRYYVARTDNESTHYLVLSLLGPEAGKTGTSVLRNAWSYAWYRKGYALVELQRPAEARAALDQALALSPVNALILIERAEASKLLRDWPTAMAFYREAEAAAEFSPEGEASLERSQAMRGQAFVYIEVGQLDDAEKVLRACLKLNARDARAQQELDYIAKLRAAGKP
jgi:tetratricopeptide (TPR) repeat protein